MSTFIAVATLVLAGLDLAVFGGSVMAEACAEGEEILRSVVEFLKQ
jgi:hypothetical protein